MLSSQIPKVLDQHASHLELARQCLHTQLDQLIRERGLNVQSVSSRMKSCESLRRKIARPDKTYRELWDVTDLVGLRVVTFFEHTIEEVASLIENSFDVDFHHSTNKLQYTDHDRFGYRSLHYICHTTKGFDNLASVGLPAEFRFEIQIRTLLQHAWAEIEHDLGYKAGDLAPAKFRRRFSRVASLLEIADQEFVSLQKELALYANSLTAVDQDAETRLELDSISLASLVNHPSVYDIDSRIAREMNCPLGDTVFFPDYLVKMLRLVGIQTVGEALNEAREKADAVASMVKPYLFFLEKVWDMRPDLLENVPRGYSLLLLAHIVALESESLAINKVRQIAKIYETLDEQLADMTTMDVATRLFEALSEAGHSSTYDGRR